MIIVPDIHQSDRDRTEMFHQHAQARARGEMVATPLMMDKERRRLYVRQTMREDHQFRLELKQARRSVLVGLVPEGDGDGEKASNVVNA